MKIARIYLRVSTDEQDVTRQETIIEQAKNSGYYIAGVYKESASGARADRPELLRMISDLQVGDVVIAEKIDRISRLPLSEAENLIQSIKNKGAKLSIPNIVDLSDCIENSEGISKIVMEATQDLLLKLALQMARDDYEDRRERQKQGIEIAKAEGKYKGKKPNENINNLIVKLKPHHSIKETAQLAGCSESQVKRIWKLHKQKSLSIT
ncbi:recombinase family protein [uncultured Shewanella sp.]|uniref:recombinase family protein n=1 Tax=uncultured Shewanella sp. TaxID=173975 RepID=UPI002633F97D|nr:recombinase family protein [uncultured Shewanella sp.]